MNRIKTYFSRFTRKDYFRYAYHVFLVILGNALLAFGTTVFLVPQNLVAGGLSGVAIIIQNIFPGTKIIDITVAILSWTLFLIGLVFLGKKFTLQTLISTIVYPIALSLMYRFFDSSMIQSSLSGDTGILLAGVFGGVFVGTGCAITFRGGGSTGGLDILAFLMQKYFKIKCSVGSFILDAIIIIIGFICTANNLLTTLIGITSAYVAALMIEKIFISTSSSYIAQIISVKWESINEFVIINMERGATIHRVEGGYENTEYRMVQVAFDRKEYLQLMDAVNKIDKKAFVTIVRAHEVSGFGFRSFPKKKM